MIKAVIFDCFGVLASDGWLPYKARYFSDDPALGQQATSLNKQVDSGKISFDVFMSEIARMAGVSEQTARQQVENNIPDEKVFALIESLKPRYRIGMLSNAGDNWLGKMFTPDQVALFDAVALSYEIDCTKPEPEAYRIIAERLGVEPGECIFVDDQPKYVDGARAAGMQAILFADAEQLKTDLKTLLGSQE